MRIMTSARLRAVGILLLEAAGIAVVAATALSKDEGIKTSVENLIKKARKL